jgi:nucleotide-binding universal stress UspA family protein
VYKRILVPLDGSGRAEAILPHVEEVALRFDSTVYLLQVVEPGSLHVQPEGPYSASTRPEFVAVAQEAEEYLNGLRGELRARGIAVEVHVLQGPVVPVISDFADSIDADLIAMATHGRGALARVFQGSVASQLLQHLDRPMLLVRS